MSLHVHNYVMLCNVLAVLWLCFPLVLKQVGAAGAMMRDMQGDKCHGGCHAGEQGPQCVTCRETHSLQHAWLFTHE